MLAGWMALGMTHFSHVYRLYGSFGVVSDNCVILFCLGVDKGLAVAKSAYGRCRFTWSWATPGLREGGRNLAERA